MCRLKLLSLSCRSISWEAREDTWSKPLMDQGPKCTAITMAESAGLHSKIIPRQDDFSTLAVIRLNSALTKLILVLFKTLMEMENTPVKHSTKI